jgi:hypothetical protein
MTIYEKTTDGLITTGERNVQSFPSGLVRVDRKYVAADGNGATHRATLAVNEVLPDDDGLPAVDGLYIFPEPQESSDGTGFTTYQASAYGRTSATARITGQTQENITSPILPNSELTLTFTSKVISGAVVVPTGTILTADDITIPEDIYKPYNFRNLRLPHYKEQSVVEIDTIYSAIQVRVYQVTFSYNESTVTVYVRLRDPQITITAQRNFGQWTEVEYQTTRVLESTSDTI